ncbi:2TM domain-containing protein [Alteromonas antoniana]|uniref:2TM domain-containing protein n=1 Tax=Alteromonas antoniana TaxID=2803813 RepID=UPI001C655641|nr:2TM domain-containing protein [Alteromonas antoniana]
MIIRKLRLQHGWSQDQLAQFSGLNIRTVQRIERGQQASLESLKSLAAVFDIDVSELATEEPMESTTTITAEEAEALERVRDLKAFYTHLMVFVVSTALMFVVNLMVSPWYLWAVWALVGWGFGIMVHGIAVFETFSIFGPKWEKKQVEKRLKRNL